MSLEFLCGNSPALMQSSDVEVPEAGSNERPLSQHLMDGISQ